MLQCIIYKDEKLNEIITGMDLDSNILLILVSRLEEEVITRKTTYSESGEGGIRTHDRGFAPILA